MSKCAEGCDCGRHKSPRPPCLAGCTCRKHPAVEDMVGRRFGTLVITQNRATGQPGVEVRCDCGQTGQRNLFGLTDRSHCGAGYHRTGSQNPNYRHGQTVGSATSTYNIWAQIVQRTTNPTNARWADYGGRGIDLDPRWLTFATFLADMGERPDGLTIERVDNNKGYWPTNCRWATYTDQRHNRRDTP